MPQAAIAVEIRRMRAAFEMFKAAPKGEGSSFETMKHAPHGIRNTGYPQVLAKFRDHERQSGVKWGHEEKSGETPLENYSY